MRKRNLIVIWLCVCLTFLCAWAARLYAGEHRDEAKKRVAVLEVKAVNIPREASDIARNAVELFLFNTQAFEILERDQVDVVSQERDKKIRECNDADCAAKIGALVSADYVVIGTIDRLDRYTITVKLIEVRTNSIIATATEQFESLEQLRSAAEKAAQDIAFLVTNAMSGSMHGTGKLAPTLAAKFHYLMPAGRFAGIMGNGYGACLHAGLENLFVRGLQAGINSHFFFFEGKIDKTRNAFLIPIIFEAGYAFSISRFSIIPSFGGGISYNVNSYYRFSSMFDYTTLKAWQAVTREELELCCFLTPWVALQIDGSFWQVYEKDATTLFASVSAGVRLRF